MLNTIVVISEFFLLRDVLLVYRKRKFKNYALSQQKYYCSIDRQTMIFYFLRLYINFSTSCAVCKRFAQYRR